MSVHDTLKWTIKDSASDLYPVTKKFLLHRNAIRVGHGEIGADIAEARKERAFQRS